MSTDLADKKGIPGSIHFGPGIFFARTSSGYRGAIMGAAEKVLLRPTLSAVREQDSFQGNLIRGMNER